MEIGSDWGGQHQTVWNREGHRTVRAEKRWTTDETDRIRVKRDHVVFSRPCCLLRLQLWLRRQLLLETHQTPVRWSASATGGWESRSPFPWCTGGASGATNRSFACSGSSSALARSPPKRGPQGKQGIARNGTAKLMGKRWDIGSICDRTGQDPVLHAFIQLATLLPAHAD